MLQVNLDEVTPKFVSDFFGEKINILKIKIFLIDFSYMNN